MGWQDGTPVSELKPATTGKQPAWMQGAPVEQIAAPATVPAPPIGTPAPKEASFIDMAQAPFDTARAFVQNIGATGIGTGQAVLEDLAAKAFGNAPVDAPKRAEELAQKYGYQSKNPLTQRVLSEVGDIAKTEPVRLLAGIGPGGGVVQEAAQMATTAPVAAQIGALASKPAQTVRQALQGREKPAMAGGGAAVTEAEALRRQRAADLPVPITLSKGEATRDFDALRLEKEGQKASGPGGDALRAHAADNVESVLKNFEAWIDETGAQAPDLISAGKAIDKPLVKRMESAKAEIRNAYDKARNAGDMAQPIDTGPLVKLIEMRRAASEMAPVLSAAESELIRLGGAKKMPNGELAPGTIPINDLEEARKLVVRLGKKDDTNGHYASEINQAIDSMTEGKGGALYQEARGKFKDYAAEFKNQGAVRKLVSTKPGTTDRAVALEDVWQHTVLGGSNQDTQNILRSLEKAGPEGAQAINEIRGQTVKYVMDQTFKNASLDIRGNPIPSYAKAKQTINSLDADGKLDLLFGKKGAEQMRDIRDLIGDIQTAPPGVVNTSTTGAVLKEAMEALVTGRLPTATAKGIAGIRSAITESKKNKQYMQQLKQPE